MRPDESDDSDESVRAKGEKVSGRSSAGSDRGDDDDGSGSDSAKSTTARKRRPTVDELAKDDPDLARQLQLADKANAIKYMIAHARVPEAGTSSDEPGDADDPAGALARGGARSLQLGARQAARLERRLQKHHGTVSSSARAPAAAEPVGTSRGSASGAWKAAAAESASDGELTLDRSMRTPAAASHAGPHAALSGLAQHAASTAIGTVRHLAGGAVTADSPDSFVGVDVDGHNCTARGMQTRSHPPEPPAGSSDAAEGPISRSELDLPELGRPSVTVRSQTVETKAIGLRDVYLLTPGQGMPGA